MSIKSPQRCKVKKRETRPLPARWNASANDAAVPGLLSPSITMKLDLVKYGVEWLRTNQSTLLLIILPNCYQIDAQIEIRLSVKEVYYNKCMYI